MKIIAVIPARYNSSRFPGKPLALINNKPMIQHVYERAKQVKNIDEVIVATDDSRIYETVISFSGKAIMTKVSHESGSDRIAEIADKIDGDIFINIQGDEPLLDGNLIEGLVNISIENIDKVVTAKTEIKEEKDIFDPNVVKVTTDLANNAMYFSRSTIPYNRSKEKIKYYKHLGIYCYPKAILKEFVNLPKSNYENVEMLEQLRLLENGIKIKVIESKQDSIGVDVYEDIKKVEKILEDEVWVLK
ncbi:3-deoxy-manno-octulosonate cytidylyltransferase [Niallia circulans]|uniref:3-deoxy-manno-octulosonate cytidylyltransferase n=1 Tax=Niallia circulans TaxID=1397 RepID=UPI001F16CFBD|nr:3-deoxy-manno-octulosonate cytidylyltransferase [Niallia circulans]MCF2649125.1 3-deoxy-manno-octulosonate cytidylyltransferase [Niallia circulans]